MNHLPAADVDSAVGGVDGDIARLRIGYLRVTQESVGSAQAAVAAGKAVANEARAIEAFRSHATPAVVIISLVQDGICAAEDGAGINAAGVSRRAARRGTGIIVVIIGSATA